MKLLGFLVIVAIIAACTAPTSEVVCNSPYIRYADGCCLDTDTNGICDEDESAAVETPEEPTAEPPAVPSTEPETPADTERGDYLFSVGFADGAPPFRIPDQGLLTFSITIEVSNLGERTLPKEDGRVEVGGIINPAALGLTSLSQLRAPLPDDLRPGETVNVEFPGLTLPGKLKYDNRGDIQANFCYIALTGGETCMSRDARYEIVPAEEWTGP